MAGPEFTIGQLAQRSGFSASTLRYYERSGLLTPIARTGAGYRLYDETSQRRLRFVSRAKRLGCSLDEIVDLLSLIDRDECRPVQSRFHTLVTDKLDAARVRRAELAELMTELQRAATQLRGEPVDGPCDEDCACHDVPSLPGSGSGSRAEPVTSGRPDNEAVACSLDPGEVDDRILAWRDLLRFVTERESIDGKPGDGAVGLRLGLDPTVPADDLVGLATAEQGCCTFFSFAVTIDERGLALEVRAPGQAASVLDAVFGPRPVTDPSHR